MAQQEDFNQSHDKFFRHLLSKEERAKSFLQGILPPDIQELVDWNTLGLSSESFVDDKLRISMADVVYTCQVSGSPAYITFLFEHKSYAPKYPHVQLLRYMVNLWERQTESGKLLYPIIPVVMYHGRSKWKEGEFSDFIFGMVPALRVFVPDFSYTLLNVQTEDDEQLEEIFYRDIVLLRGMLLMKHIFDDDLPERLQQLLLDLVDPNYDESYRKNFRTFVVYAGNYISVEDEQKLERVMTLEEELDYFEVPEDHWLRGWFDNIRQKIIEKDKARAKREGRAEGLAEGLAEGKTKGLNLAFALVQLFQKNKSTKEIALQLQLPEDEVLDMLKKLGLQG